MAKVRVYQLAKELGLSNKELLAHLHDLGVEVKSHSSSLEEETVTIVKDALAPVKKPDESPPPQPEPKPAAIKKSEAAKDKKQPKETKPTKEAKADEDEPVSDKIIKIPETIVVAELAKELGVSGNELIKTLISHGEMVTINQYISFEMAGQLAADFGFIVEESGIYGDDIEEEEEEDVSKLVHRGPIVTIMGHVDHGKTRLLDTIRNSDVISGEAGGITQHIGAYHVDTERGPIVFLDTPGHEAFTAMRARGAQVTDIVVLVIAADDGVMPQTVEAIDHAKAAGVPIVVAVNKIDKPDADPDKVKQQLTQYELVSEEWGGQTIFVEISAKENINIDELLEMISLQAEILELKANPEAAAKGTVIEAKLDKGRGAVATILIQRGTLSVGDSFVVGACYGKVRAMFDDHGRRINSTGPATAIEVIGFNGIPQTGEVFNQVDDEKSARGIGRRRQAIDRERGLHRPPKVTLEELFKQIETKQIKELRLILKADVRGSIEAIVGNLAKLKSTKVQVKILHTGVGIISPSDVMLAAASSAIVIGFHVTGSPEATQLASSEEVDIRLYDIIYKINDDITKAMEGLLEPIFEEMITGHAEVRQLFKVPKLGIIAGSYVTDGKFNRNSLVRVLRDQQKIFEGKIGSLKRFKEDVKEVRQGFECGIGVEGFAELKEADIIESYEMKEVAAKL